MKNVKVVFIGNPLGGDDGIGPFLYNELKNSPQLKKYQLLELGVIGFDLISYIDDRDILIIVDAVYSQKDIGQVVILEEKDLSKDISLVSMHDFGVEQTVTILRRYKPTLKKINVIGVYVQRINAFTDELSDDLKKMIPKIKKDVVKYIIQIAASSS
jgi:hydrogenase maturation protease